MVLKTILLPNREPDGIEIPEFALQDPSLLLAAVGMLSGSTQSLEGYDIYGQDSLNSCHAVKVTDENIGILFWEMPVLLLRPMSAPLSPRLSLVPDRRDHLEDERRVESTIEKAVPNSNGFYRTVR